jgi:hypothetical protein
VLPTDEETTETSRRLIHYHIGFTDLPAVKILIPCNKVLDYVSPRELEDWEYRNSDTREEERAHVLARKTQAVGAAEKQAARSSNLSAADAGVSVLRPAEEALRLVKEVAGPSLSTPQKRKLDRIRDEDTGESNSDSDDAAIHRQLHGDAESEGTGNEYNFGADSESVDQLALHFDPSGTGTPSRVGASVPPKHDLDLASSTPTLIETAFPPPAAPAPKVSPNNLSTPGRIHPAWANAFGVQNRLGKLPDPHGQNGHAKQNGLGEKTPWSGLATSQNNSRQFKPSGSSLTPVSKGGGRNGSRGSASQFPTPRTAAKSAVSAQEKESKKHSKKKQQGPKHEKEPANDEWEVKDLLDDQWFFEQGAKVHKFLILWEGNWPEDQNPTWEPAENVQDETLVKRYYKRKKAGLLKPLNKRQKTLHQYLSQPQYSSVAEAFEGGIDQHAGLVARDIEGDTDPPEERFLVTENAGDVSANGTKPTPSFQSFDGMLARYKETFLG